MHIVPLPLTGAGAQFAPVPDRAHRSADDPQLFTGHLWLMSAGAWQVRITVNGDRGEGTMSVPVPTLAAVDARDDAGAARAPDRILMLLLGAGFVGIVSAMAREATARRRRGARSRARSGAAALPARSPPVVIGGVVFLGNMWWTVEATAYDRYVYKPLIAGAAV